MERSLKSGAEGDIYTLHTRVLHKAIKVIKAAMARSHSCRPWNKGFHARGVTSCDIRTKPCQAVHSPFRHFTCANNKEWEQRGAVEYKEQTTMKEKATSALFPCAPTLGQRE